MIHCMIVLKGYSKKFCIMNISLYVNVALQLWKKVYIAIETIAITIKEDVQITYSSKLNLRKWALLQVSYTFYWLQHTKCIF